MRVIIETSKNCPKCKLMINKITHILRKYNVYYSIREVSRELNKYTPDTKYIDDPYFLEFLSKSKENRRRAYFMFKTSSLTPTIIISFRKYGKKKEIVIYGVRLSKEFLDFFEDLIYRLLMEEDKYEYSVR